jgi:hypothetical protein
VIGLTLEWGMRKTTTDYIDDVSPFTPGKQAHRSIHQVITSEGMQRGNSKDNDWYSFAGVSVVFRINFRGSADCDEPHRIRF